MSKKQDLTETDFSSSDIGNNISVTSRPVDSGGAVINIGYCFKEKGKRLLANTFSPSTDKLYVLIITKRGYLEERFLYRGSLAFYRADFIYPDKHDVRVMVFKSPLTYDRVKKIINQKRKSGNYELDFNNTLYFDGLHQDSGINLLGYEDILVDVAAGHFAKDLPTALNWWVNFGYERDARHQCEARQRAFIGIVKVPLYLVFYGITWSIATVIKVIWLILALLLGIRFTGNSYNGIDLKSFKRYSFNPKEDLCQLRMFDDCGGGGSWFFCKLDGSETPYRILYTPLIVIIITMLMLTFGSFITQNSTLLLVGSPLAALAVISSFLIGTHYRIKYAAHRNINNKTTKRYPTEATKQRMIQTYLASVETCEAGAVPPLSLDEVPKHKVTLRIALLSAKNSSCKPFAGK